MLVGKKNCYADELWQQKNCKFCTMFWTPKWGLKNGPKNGARIWPPKWGPKMAPQKWGPKMAPKRRPNILIKKKSKLYLHLNPFLGAIFAPHFGVPFLDPILGVKFWHHFWVHFSTPILGSRTWCKICNFFCCQSFHLHSNFFQQACITKCICSHCLASCISAHNPILHLAKPLKKRKVLIATNVAHEQDGLKPQNLILWRSLNAAPVFHMKNDPRFGGSSKLIFLEQKPASCINWQWWCINVSASWPWQCWSSSRIHKINLRTLTRNFDYSHRFQKWWWLSGETSNLSYLLARNRIVQESKSKKNSNWAPRTRRPGLHQIKRHRWKGEEMEKQKGMTRGALGPPIQGSTRSRDAPPNLQSSTQKKGLHWTHCKENVWQTTISSS